MTKLIYAVVIVAGVIGACIVSYFVGYQAGLINYSTGVEVPVDPAPLPNLQIHEVNVDMP